MSLQTINLNLLPLLRALLKLRSVTLAARSLGVSQSAASQGLTRLRTQLNDPLLVRISGHMQLTPLAKRLIPRVEHVACELHDVFLPIRFDPATAERRFIIASNDYQVFLIGRALLDLRRAEAPGIDIQFIEIGQDYAERMAAQEIDFALLPRFAVRDLTVAPLRYRALRRDPVALLMDRGHKLARQTLITKADLEHAEFVAFSAESLERQPANNWQTSTEVGDYSDVVRNVAIRTNHFTLIPMFLRDTDLVALVPLSLGVELSRIWPTAVRPVSFGPPGIEIGVAWSPVFDADPAHVWLRTQIAQRMAVVA